MGQGQAKTVEFLNVLRGDPAGQFFLFRFLFGEAPFTFFLNELIDLLEAFTNSLSRQHKLNAPSLP